MKTGVDEEDRLFQEHADSVAGDYLELRAERDCLVANNKYRRVSRARKSFSAMGTPAVAVAGVGRGMKWRARSNEWQILDAGNSQPA